MNESSDNQGDAGGRERIVASVDKMVSGRITGQEAERMRAADGPGEIDAAITDIRVRHAGKRLGAAVDAGSLTQEEADGFLQRLRNGDHSGALRAQLRRLLPRGTK